MEVTLYKHEEWTVELSDEAVEGIKKLTYQDLLKHMHDNAVGHVTPSGDSKFIKQLVIGNVHISMQLSYQLGGIRENHLYTCGNGSPMTEDEFIHLMGETEDEQISNFDVDSLVYIERKYRSGETYNSDLMDAAQRSIGEVVDYLKKMVENGKIAYSGY